MKKLKLAFFVGLLTAVSPLCALASVPNINGEWVSVTNPNVTIEFRDGVSQVNTGSANPPCGGAFRARVAQEGDSVVLVAPLSHKDGGRNFNVNFVLKGGRLVEKPPYPSNDMERLGYWHGAACGFGLSEGHAVFVKK